MILERQCRKLSESSWRTDDITNWWDVSPDDIEMHVIGHDHNVKRKPMETVAEESQQVIISFNFWSLRRTKQIYAQSQQKNTRQGVKYVQSQR